MGELVERFNFFDECIKLNKIQAAKQILEDAFDNCEYLSIGNRIKIVSVANTAGFFTLYVPKDDNLRKQFKYNLSFCLNVDISLAPEGSRAPLRCNLYCKEANDYNDDERTLFVTVPAVGNLTDYQTHQILALSNSYRIKEVINRRMNRFKLLARRELGGEDIEIPLPEDCIDKYD